MRKLLKNYQKWSQKRSQNQEQQIQERGPKIMNFRCVPKAKSDSSRNLPECLNRLPSGR